MPDVETYTVPHHGGRQAPRWHRVRITAPAGSGCRIDYDDNGQLHLSVYGPGVAVPDGVEEPDRGIVQIIDVRAEAER